MLIAHGVNKVFGEGGIAGTARWFESLGFRPAWLHARVAAATEIGAGTLMVLGLLTPLSCTAFVGLMVVATFTDHRGKGFFIFRGGWEYTGLIGLTAVCVAALGPGGWSIDSAVGWRLFGLPWAGVVLVVGLTGGASFVLMLGQRISSRPTSRID
jgi:putative oxidoreductase